MTKKELFRNMVEDLKRHRIFTLSWKDTKYHKKNVGSYTDALYIAKSCELAGFYTYQELLSTEPRYIHISRHPIEDKRFLPLKTE